MVSVTQILSEINMGQKALNKKSKNTYTFGAELEVEWAIEPSIDKNRMEYIINVYSKSLYEIIDFFNEYYDENIDNHNIDKFMNKYLDDLDIMPTHSDNRHVKNSSAQINQIKQTVKKALIQDDDFTDEELSQLKMVLTYLDYDRHNSSENVIIKSIRKEQDILNNIEWDNFSHGFLQNQYDKYQYIYRDKSLKSISRNIKVSLKTTSKFYQEFRKYIMKYFSNEFTVKGNPIDYLDNSEEIQSLNIEKISGDGSLKNGAEIITNVYDNLDIFLSELSIMLDFIAKDDNLKTTKKTGIHINVGTFKPDDKDWLKFLVILNGEKVIEDFDRTHNKYTQTFMHDYYSSLQNSNLNDYETLKSNINTTLIDSSEHSHYIDISRLPYEGYIEFRAMGGKGYELRKDEIINNVKKIIRVLDIAGDPESYRNEYLKKLYSTINQDDSGTEEDNKVLSFINRTIGLIRNKSGATANKKITNKVYKEIMDEYNGNTSITDKRIAEIKDYLVITLKTHDPDKEWKNIWFMFKKLGIL